MSTMLYTSKEVDMTSTINRIAGLKATLGILTEKFELKSEKFKFCQLTGFKYIESNPLGRGKFGVVYKACLTKNCYFPVAIKMILFHKGWKPVTNEWAWLFRIRNEISKSRLISNFLLLIDGDFCIPSENEVVAKLAGYDPNKHEDKCLIIITELLEPLYPREIKNEWLYSLCLQFILIFVSNSRQFLINCIPSPYFGLNYW